MISCLRTNLLLKSSGTPDLFILRLDDFVFIASNLLKSAKSCSVDDISMLTVLLCCRGRKPSSAPQSTTVLELQLTDSTLQYHNLYKKLCGFKRVLSVAYKVGDDWVNVQWNNSLRQICISGNGKRNKSVGRFGSKSYFNFRFCSVLWEVLGQLTTRENSPSDKNKAQPGSWFLGLLHTRTTSHQDHCKPLKPIIRTNIYTVWNCPYPL